MMVKHTLLAGLLLGLAAVPANAKVVELEDDAFVTRETALVKADKREVWLALISPSKWWNEAHTFSGKSTNLTLMPKAGGCFCELIPGDDTTKNIGLDGSVEHMRVLLAIPDQALRMTGALGPLQSEPVNAVLTVTIAEGDDGTAVTFEYAVGGYMRYKSADISKAVDGVMSLQLAGLAKLLGPAAPPAKTPKPEAKPAEPEAKPSVGEAFGDLSEGN